LRATRQRAAITEALGAANGFRSAQEIFDSVRERGEKVGLTTVYRTLQALAEVGEVDVLRVDDKEAVYRRCDSVDHHHHLVCRSCARSIEVESAEVEGWAARISGRHGFTDVTHTAEVYGVCRLCSGGDAT
jgi:Fur family transcriptional regulator, ferric uptake regulator